MCDLDTLCLVLATAKQLSDISPAVLQSLVWRAVPANEDALLLAVWDPAHVT